MSDARLHVNGINAESGGYLTEPATPEDLARAALGESLPPDQLGALASKWRRGGEEGFVLGGGYDPRALDEAGWGVIFPAVEGDEARKRQDAVREALGPLLDRRKAQAGARYKEYLGADGCGPNET